MSNLEIKLDALLRLCTTDDPQEQASIREEIRRMSQGAEKHSKATDEEVAEYEIRNILMQLGAPDHLVGHPYMVRAILLVIQDRDYINAITFGLYPQLAVMFDTTASRVERAIRHLIEVMWTRGDYETLNRYFGSIVSPNKGKPTNGEFIARIANVVNMKLKYGNVM